MKRITRLPDSTAMLLRTFAPSWMTKLIILTRISMLTITREQWMGFGFGAARPRWLATTGKRWMTCFNRYDIMPASCVHCMSSSRNIATLAGATQQRLLLSISSGDQNTLCHKLHTCLNVPDLEQVVYFKTLKEMMQEGWLSQVKAKRIRTDIRVNPIKITKGDYQINQLSEAINSPDRNELIVEQYKRYCQGLRQSTLIFCVDIAHVTALEEAFRLSHVHCASVTAKTNAYDRQRIMEEFCRGELPVLLNCAVLTEGTDVPNVDCVILARPTCSQPLFTQMVGRGLRQHPGKADCLVLDIVDNFDKHSLSNVSFSLLGLSSETTDVQGRAVVEKTEEEVKEQKDEQKEKAEVFVGAFANTQMTVEDLDAYREMVPSATFMERAMVSVDDAWALKLKAGCICMFYNPATELYEAMLLPNSARGQLQRIPMTCESEDQAFKAIMTHVRDRYTHEFKMLVLNQQASSAPATNNQLRLLNKLIPHAPIAQHLTKSQATKKIGDTLARRTVKQWRRRLGDMLQG
eukprot:TRINITY_DN11921_c0_g1_i11.p1 TRINITY_DN11921_c0_g1~~TRINITY_DN11921_c0_g1_i11.p1  ORF type:complete len:520 (+),score=123.65 TRINITY_DN11921_c0_g1_i11:688-2247(+)